MGTAEQQSLITEDKYITPLVQILEEVTPKTQNDPPKPKDMSKSVSDTLDILFPEQKHQEKALQKARETLGELAESFTTDQLKDSLTEIQYLVDSWLDDFERQTFGGLTLKELLHEKGSL